MEILMKLDLADFGNIFRRSPTDLDAQELLALDFILHRAALKPERRGGGNREGRSSGLDGARWESPFRYNRPEILG